MTGQALVKGALGGKDLAAKQGGAFEKLFQGTSVDWPPRRRKRGDDAAAGRHGEDRQTQGRRWFSGFAAMQRLCDKGCLAVGPT
ncbi:hypothetical protein GCM10010983_27830 [Caulobacter rhizosphaerae]|nr:hypothetical protein GCM10010983_27830 [Caulobacter rhizosphaerae]